ncbi:MAG TPA: tetratricopeptide repeat protein [Promineifilum sp.]|nr:tetratricopeptide repeat protein [Promineifilum sp.]
MIKEPRLRTLLTQANRNAQYGKNAAAESIYRQILAEAPDAEEAWAGLAEVVIDPEEKRAAYERALALSPDYPPAVAGLAGLDGRPVPPEVEAALAPAEEAVAVIEPDPPATQPGPVSIAPQDSHSAFETVCYRHPDRSTSLRCYNCNRPICISCANKTPVGYICPECRREAEDAFYNNKPLDYVVAALVSLPISLLAGYLMVRFFSGGFLFFILIFFVSGAIGSFIGRVTKRAIGGRRGRYLPALVVAMMILGVVIPALPVLLSIFLGSPAGLLGLLGPAIYLFVGAGAAYWQMR